MREPALSPLQAACAGAMNPVVMKLLASVDALHADTSQRDKRDKEMTKAMTANTAAIKKRAKVEEVSIGSHRCHALDLPPLSNMPLLLYSNALSGALFVAAGQRCAHIILSRPLRCCPFLQGSPLNTSS